MKKVIAAVVVLGASLSGCSLVPLADAGRDAELKTFAVTPAKAGLYIYRNDAAAALVRVDVRLNGQLLGKTATQTYLYREVTPGKYRIESISGNDEALEVDARAGALVFVRQEITLGAPMFPGTKLQLMSEEDGKKGVLESKLAQTR